MFIAIIWVGLIVCAIAYGFYQDNVKPEIYKRFNAIAKYKHPELKRGEFFLTNATFYDFRNSIGWKSKRLGDTAYYAWGEPVIGYDQELLYPVFIKIDEIIKKGKVDLFLKETK